MKTQIEIAALALTFLAAVASPASAQTAPELFQRALVKEQAEGDLRGAITLYERVASEFEDERALGARALVQAGRCYEKLGSRQARRAYRTVLEDYPEQTEMAVRARARLAALEGSGGDRATDPSAISTRRLGKWVHGETAPLAVTLDAGALLYLDTRFGNLALLDLATGESRGLTQDSSFSVWGAAVSPDGRRVSYQKAEGPAGSRPTGSSLRLVGIDGSGSRLLHRKPGCWIQAHAWVPDGTAIVGLSVCPGGAELLRIPTSGGEAEPVVALEPGRPPGLSVSPDGRFVAYGVAVEGDEGNQDIRLAALADGAAGPLVDHPADDRLLGWLPGTAELLFLSDRSGTTDLWAVAVEDGAADGPPRLVRRAMGEAEPVGITDQGALVYMNYTRWFSTAVAPLDPATGAIDVESRVEVLGSVLPATWSPDGESIAFVVEEERPNARGGRYRRPLHVRHLATGTERALASHIQARNQRWSPDGGRILFNGWDTTVEREDYRGGLYVVDVESGDATPVLELEPETEASFWSDLGAAWARDGSAVIYSLYDNNLDEGRLVWRDLESGAERELFRDPGLTSRMLAVSPDGRLVFGVRASPEGYASAIHSGGRLMILDLDDGGVQELHAIRERGRVWSLQWSPDGRHVLYTKRDGEKTSLWRVPISGGDAESLWTFEGDHYDAFLDLSPDGRRAAYTTYHQEFEVWIMEHLFAALGHGAGGR